MESQLLESIYNGNVIGLIAITSLMAVYVALLILSKEPEKMSAKFTPALFVMIAFFLAPVFEGVTVIQALAFRFGGLSC